MSLSVLGGGSGTGGGSNRNLLDNPWFTVNQRGQSSYTPSWNGYSFDRWNVESNENLTITKNTDGSITITNTSTNDNQQFKQLLDMGNLIDGKQYTLSINVVSYSGEVRVYFANANSPYNAFTRRTVESTGILFNSGEYTTTEQAKVYISLYANATITISAVKLELGTQSTLSMDSAPDYATELLKCQRYFVRMRGNDAIFAQGYIHSTTTAIFSAYVPTEMRTTPTLSVSSSGVIKNVYNSVYATITSSNLSISGSSMNRIIIYCTSTYDSTYKYCPSIIKFNDVNAYIDFSADL